MADVTRAKQLLAKFESNPSPVTNHHAPFAEMSAQVKKLSSIFSIMSNLDMINDGGTYEGDGLFEDWVARGFLRKTHEGEWRITRLGEATYWAMRPAGCRENDVSVEFEYNGLSMIDEFITTRSLAFVVDSWNPAVAGEGLILSEEDVLREILRWKISPPGWIDNDIAAKVDSAYEILIETGVLNG